MEKCACCGRDMPEYDNLWSGIYDDVCIDCEKKVNEMQNLIKRWQQLDRGEICYGELVECEKERVEERMGDLVCWTRDKDGGFVDKYLEDLIPSPICWK